MGAFASPPECGTMGARAPAGPRGPGAAGAGERAPAPGKGISVALTVALDYRPALFRGFGIGRYVDNLVRAMLQEDPELRLKLFGPFLRGRRDRLREHCWPDPGRATFHGPPLPARIVGALGRWTPLSARTFCGPFDLFHDTDYAVTPVSGRPRVATIYDAAFLQDGYVSSEQGARMRGIVERLLRGEPRVLTLTAFAREEIVRHFDVDPERITVAPLGVDALFRGEVEDAEIARVRSRHGVQEPYVMAIGTLEPRKNLVRLIRAFAAIVADAPEHRLVLVGRRGHASERIFAEIEALELGDSVTWLGHLPDAEMLPLLKGAAALAFVSLYEGFGLPAIEGMAAGVPVLSSDAGALREVCGEGALLVDPRQEDEIYRGLRTLLFDRGEAAEVAERGQERSASFTWESCARTTLQVYREAVEEAR